MNARRPPAWPKLIAGILVVALLVAALVFMSRLLLGALNLLHTDGGESQPDPQFAEPAVAVTAPPELFESGEAPDPDDDPSSRWVEEIQTPVDKTADELALEDDPEA